MTTAKKSPPKKPAAAKEEPEAVEAKEDAPKGTDKPYEIIRTTEVAWNGMTATETVNGETTVRPATLAEQLERHAPDILSLVVGSVPYAANGAVEVDGEKITIQLYPN